MIQGLPEKLQGLRARHGYSQRQVAAMIGVSPSIVSGYETGERTPSAEVLLALAAVYRCTTDYLFGKDAPDVDMTLNVEGLSNEQVQALRNLIGTMKK